MRLCRRHRARVSLLAVAWLFVCAGGNVAARDPDAFDLLESGAASPSTTLVNTGMSTLRARWHVTTASGEAVEMREDATYAVEGAPTNTPTRATLVSDLGGAPRESLNESLDSRVIVLHGVNGYSGTAPIDGTAPDPVHGVLLRSADGVRKVSLAAAGQVDRLQATGVTSTGEPYGGVGGAFEDPAARVESTDRSVVSVTATGLVGAQGDGLAWVRFVSDGEWTQILAEVDTSVDSDGDGMPDSWEIEHGLDPLRDDADEDPDGDGLSNLEELRRGTRPDDDDTDGDHLDDGEEVLLYGTDPATGDTDSDTSPDDVEVLVDTDPLDPNDRGGTRFDPELVGTRDLSFWVGKRLAVAPDGHVYVVTDDDVLVVYRLRRSPFVLLRLDQKTLSSDLRGVAVDGDVAYVAAGADGLHIINRSGAGELIEETTVEIDGGVNSVLVENGLIYAAGGSGLTALRRRGPGDIETLGHFTSSTIGEFAIHADIAYVSLRLSRQLVSVDISDPSRPRRLDSLQFPEGVGLFSGLVAMHKSVYVAHGSRGILVVSNEDPTELRFVDDSQEEFPGDAFTSIAALGRRLVAFTPSEFGTAQVFRILESGAIEHDGTAPLGTDESILDLTMSQEFLVALSPSLVSFAQVLPSGDDGSVAPRGRVVLEGYKTIFAPGDTATVTAYARDDVYVEHVRFYVDGVVRVDDQVPPFRIALQIEQRPRLPYDVHIRAVGYDLAGASGEIGSVTYRVDRDLDGDGIPDGVDHDRDGDGLPDVEELHLGVDGWISSPDLVDTDGDGIDDAEEVVEGEDGWITDPSSPDTDGDGLSDPYEISVLQSNPADADGDDDGILDGEEDPDGDGLVNREEVEIGTDPNEADSDGDQLADGLEWEIGLDPTEADSDGDGVADADEDSDGDGLPNRVEVTLGTHPGLPDTDGDGLDDATETDTGSDPTEVTDFSDLDVVFRHRTVLLATPLEVKSLTLVDSTVTVPPATLEGPTSLVLDVEETLSIDAMSGIDVSERGFLGGRSGANPAVRGLAPGGVTRASELSGGSHGGTGGRLDADEPIDAHSVFGSVVAPRSAGAGGSALAGAGRGGDGGGVMRVRAGAVELDGVLLAYGEGVPAVAVGGAGAGGSIWITCGSLSGSGRISADGGDSSTASGAGAGGGGRVVIETDDLDDFDVDNVTAYGGRLSVAVDRPFAYGAPGTVLLRELDLSGGHLRVLGGGVTIDEPRSPLPGVGSGVVAELGDDFLVRQSGDFPPDIVGLRIDPSADDEDSRALHIVAQSGDTIWTEPGLLELASIGDTYRGVLDLESLTVSSGANVTTGDRLVLRSADVPLAVAGGKVGVEELVFAAAPLLRLIDGTLEVGTLRSWAVEPLDIELIDAQLRLLRALEAGAIDLDRSLLVAGGPLVMTSFGLERSRVTVPDSRAGFSTLLDIDVVGAMVVDSTSSVDLVGRGLVGAYGPGNDSAIGETPEGVRSGDPASGGSSAGVGGGASTGGHGGEGYGFFDAPWLPGAGGSAEEVADPVVLGVLGGNGGGVLRLRAGSLEVAGLVDASGAGAQQRELLETTLGGAGGGGGVDLEVGVLSGSGTIRADGGDARGDGVVGHGGAGGGGRIALVYTAMEDFTGELSVSGGRVRPGPTTSVEADGGAGTLYLRASAGVRGDVVIDGEGSSVSGPVTVLGESLKASGGDVAEGTIELRSLSILGGAFVDSVSTVDVELPDSTDPDRFTLLGGLRGPGLLLPDVRILVMRGGGLDVGRLEAAAGGIERYELRDSFWTVRQPIRGTTVNVRGESVLTVPDSTIERHWILDVELTGAFVLEPASRVELTGKGYVGGRRAGNENPQGQTADGVVFAAGGRTGGSHGGLGGYQEAGPALGTLVAPGHDDLWNPRLPGGGGSGRLDSDEPGHNGGGVVRIDASTVILNGVVDVSGHGVGEGGGDPSSGGAGAGGSVRVICRSLLGRGEIDADGGDADGTVGAGAGGGGRVAIYFDADFGFEASVHAFGGDVSTGGPRPSSVGGAGTVFFRGGGPGFGDLVVDNNGRAQSSARTPLRRLGIGNIEAIGAQSLRGDRSFPDDDTGLENHWVVLDAVTATPFRIVSNTAEELTTDAADGDLRSVGAVGSTYRGAIVLDNLLIRGFGAFTTGDDLIIVDGSVEIMTGGTLDSPPVVER